MLKMCHLLLDTFCLRILLIRSCIVLIRCDNHHVIIVLVGGGSYSIMFRVLNIDVTLVS